jgi:penicillin-binding protein 1C
MKKQIKVLVIIISVIFFFPLVFRLLPFTKLKQLKNQEYSLRVFDCNKNLVQVVPLKEGGRREFTPLNKIPKHIVKTFIKSEDKRFYFHHGVDFISTLKALIENLKADKIVRGSSTITMQLAKIINDSNKVSLRRKLHDVFYAYRIEAKLTKNRILELYLNSVYFGKGSWGITSASRTFFSKELKDLTEEQGRVLAVMIRNPSYYNPVNYPEHYIKFGLEKAALTAKYYEYKQTMPHFVNYVKNISKAKDYEITTTVDTNLFNFSENLLQEKIEKFSDSRISNGSLLVLNNQDNSVLCWIGNGNFFDTENSGQIDGVLVNNQPGSSMKPFLYALALDSDFIKPVTVFADVPSEFGNEKLYIPENFNNRFNGPVRLRVALASSLNIPAVSLLNKIGVAAYLSKLYELGFESLRKTGLSAGLGLALGAGEVSLFELVCAFSVFPRD